MSECTSFSCRWKDGIFEPISVPAVDGRAGAELCAPLLGSEVNSFHQCSLQGDGKLVECVQDAGEGVYSSTVSQQSSFFVGPCCQGEVCQQGEPLREKPVPAKRNRSVRVPEVHDEG